MSFCQLVTAQGVEFHKSAFHYIFSGCPNNTICSCHHVFLLTGPVVCHPRSDFTIATSRTFCIELRDLDMGLGLRVNVGRAITPSRIRNKLQLIYCKHTG